MSYPDIWGVSKDTAFMDDVPTSIRRKHYYDKVARKLYGRPYNSLKKYEKNIVEQTAGENAYNENVKIIG